MQTEILTTAASKKRGAKIIAKKTATAKNGAKVDTAAANASAVDSPYLTTQEAAAYIKMSRQFLEGTRYRGDDTGPRYLKVGRSVRYRKSVLDDWMLKHDHASDKPIHTK